MRHQITEEDVRRIIKESVNKILAESMTINDELELAADLLIRKISDNITNSKTYNDKNSGLDFYFMDADSELCGHIIRWSIKAYIFPQESKFNDIMEKYPWINDCQASSDGTSYFFGWISIPIIGKWIPKFQLSDSIYHEMLHILKAMKAGKEVGNQNFNTIADKAYNFGNNLEKNLGLVAYISREDEQDAYINGFYGQMKSEFFNNRNLDIRDAFYDSDLYEKYVELSQAEEQLLKARGTDELKQLIDKWNIKDKDGNYTTYWNEKKVFNLIKQTKQRLEQKTALAIRRFGNQMFKYMGLKCNIPNNLFKL